MILVTAATGQIGGAALAALATSGAPVRALVRDSSRFEAPPGVGIVEGDFIDDAALARALDGVTAMLLAGRDGPQSVDHHLRVLKAAQHAGVAHVVKLSAIGASAASPIALMREHHEVDECLREGAADWTLLKPHLFMQNLLRAGDQVLSEGRIRAPMGRLRFPLVDTRDVGAAAAGVLLDPGAHRGRSYLLTGPRALDYQDVAAALSVVAGRTIAYQPMPPDRYEADLLAAGLPAWRAFDLAHIASAYRPEDSGARPDLAMLLRRQPGSIAAFVEDHRGSFSR